MSEEQSKSGRGLSAPVHLCDPPEDCGGHLRRCTHGPDLDTRMACAACVRQRRDDGPDWCRTDEADGLPLPLSAYRSEP